MERVLSIQAAEGGDDAKIFVGELAKAYEKLFNRYGFSYT